MEEIIEYTEKCLKTLNMSMKKGMSIGLLVNNKLF